MYCPYTPLIDIEMVAIIAVTSERLCYLIAQCRYFIIGVMVLLCMCTSLNLRSVTQCSLKSIRSPAEYYMRRIALFSSRHDEWPLRESLLSMDCDASYPIIVFIYTFDFIKVYGYTDIMDNR